MRPGKTAVFVMLALAMATTPMGRAEEKKPDPWQPVRFLAGQWNGTSSGESGTGTVTRSYEFVLNGKFLQEKNISTYPPREAGKPGEIHEHLGMISYDRNRKTLMMRQFHQESFVNLYAWNRAAGNDTLLVFESEHFENFDNSWKARESYTLISRDEFVEVFELAPAGQPFEVYSRNHFRRANR